MSDEPGRPFIAHLSSVIAWRKHAPLSFPQKLDARRVCGGLAEWLGWSPTWVRVLYVIGSLLSVAFPGAIVYVILWLVIPKSPV